MTYDSNIYFTLDTICPWTYLGRRRLHRALAQVRATDPPVTFHLHYLPFQLYPSSPAAGEDKLAWYRRSRYGDSEEKLATYMAIMSSYGAAEQPAIDFHYGGEIANTEQAHRVIRLVQQEHGEEVTERLVQGLYRRYFEEERNPSASETLTEACVEAGVPEPEADGLVARREEGLEEVRELLREQRGNGVDAVPYVLVEGKRRDISLEGCKEVEEYVKALQQIVKESS